MAAMLKIRSAFQGHGRSGEGCYALHARAEAGWAAFHIVLAGSCLVEIADHPPLALERGHVLVLPHGDAHLIQHPHGGSGGTERIGGRFRLGHGDHGMEHMILRALPPAIILKLAGADATPLMHGPAGDMVATLLRAYLDHDPVTRGILALLADRETGRAAAAMLDDPAREWALDELAALTAVSRATLVRAFRRSGGMAPGACLRDIRLVIARSRIAHTSASFAQIAQDVGYCSQSTLSRALCHRFAIRPGAMRRLSKDALAKARHRVTFYK